MKRIKILSLFVALLAIIYVITYTLPPNIKAYIWAAFISINTSLLLFFKILPDKLFGIFRNSAYFQMFVFLVLFFIIFISRSIEPAYILLIGEIAIFLSILYGLYRIKPKQE